VAQPVSTKRRAAGSIATLAPINRSIIFISEWPICGNRHVTIVGSIFAGINFACPDVPAAGMILRACEGRRSRNPSAITPADALSFGLPRRAVGPNSVYPSSHEVSIALFEKMNYISKFDDLSLGKKLISQKCKPKVGYRS
jgi:hypothetical protein